MGAPKSNRKKYEKPKKIWDLQRIKRDSAFIKEYGLKNRRELWKVQSKLSRLRGNVRLLLSGSEANRGEEGNIISYLLRKGVLSGESPSLESVLDLNETSFLNRRLQTVVFKRGLARTIKQARQLIVHGFIAIDGKRVTRPSYMLDKDEDSKVAYYKPIDISIPGKEAEATKKADNGSGNESNSEGNAEENAEGA
ncbi:MAG: 30S ribosomal protein S4 [Candidatus Micrarchaeaceae archaeon]